MSGWTVATAVCVLALLELVWNIKLTAENEELKREIAAWDARVPLVPPEPPRPDTPRDRWKRQRFFHGS